MSTYWCPSLLLFFFPYAVSLCNFRRRKGRLKWARDDPFFALWVLSSGSQKKKTVGTSSRRGAFSENTVIIFHTTVYVSKRGGQCCKKIYSERRQRFRRPPCGLGRWATTNLHNSLQRTQPGFPQKSAMEAVPLSPFLWVTKVCYFERLSNFGLWCVGGSGFGFWRVFYSADGGKKKK